MNHVMELPDLTKDELVDINSVTIDPSQSKEERIAAYLSQIKNPYYFKCSGIEIHACYSQNGPTLAECLQQLIE